MTLIFYNHSKIDQGCDEVVVFISLLFSTYIKKQIDIKKHLGIDGCGEVDALISSSTTYEITIAN